MQSEAKKAPFGYRLDESRNLVPEPKEQRVLEIIDQLMKTGLTYNEIDATLKERRITHLQTTIDT